MNKKHLVTVVVVLVLAALVFPQTALAGNMLRFKGHNADAFFSTVDEAGIQTEVFIVTSEDIIQDPPGPGGSSSGAFITIFRFDTHCPPWLEGCPPPLVSAFGFTTLADQDFVVRGNLNSATLVATINVYDSTSDSFFDVFVDLAWTATGPVSRDRFHHQFQSPGCKFNSRSSGSSRPTVASGSVSHGLNFTPDPSVWAVIQSAKSGNVTIGCGL